MHEAEASLRSLSPSKRKLLGAPSSPSSSLLPPDEQCPRARTRKLKFQERGHFRQAPAFLGIRLAALSACLLVQMDASHKYRPSSYCSSLVVIGRHRTHFQIGRLACEASVHDGLQIGPRHGTKRRHRWQRWRPEVRLPTSSTPRPSPRFLEAFRAATTLRTCF